MSPVFRLARGWITLFVIGTGLFIVPPLPPARSREFDLSPARAGRRVTAFSLVCMLCARLFFPARRASLVRWFPGHRGFMPAVNNSALFPGISLGSLTGGQAMAAGGFRAVGLSGAAIGCLARVCVAMHREPDGF